MFYEDDKILIELKKPGEDSEKMAPGLHVINRLDKPVGGLVLFAKDKKTASALSTKENFDKVYYAVALGRIEGEGILEDLLLHDRNKNKSFVVKRERKGVKDAKLWYSSQDVFEYEGEEYTLLKIKLFTGRTHQIRVQFASRKHPLIGDGKYGSRVKGYIRLFCGELIIKDPEEKVFRVGLPDDFIPS